jgi:hypothetical protein
VRLYEYEYEGAFEEIAPRETRLFEQRVSQRGRVVGLRLDGPVDGLLLTALACDGRSMMTGGPVSAECFAPNAFSVRLDLPACESVRIALLNSTSEPRRVRVRVRVVVVRSGA